MEQSALSSSSRHAVETAPLQDTKSSDNRQVVREERTVASDGTLMVEGDPIKTGELKMPSFAKVLMNIIYGYWLTLGDYSAWNHNSKDSLLSELNNVALTAALMATVEFSIVYLLQDQPWLQAVQNLGFKNASQADADAVYDFFMVLGIIALTLTNISIIYNILIILVMAEMNDTELRDWVRHMGTRLDHGFKMFFSGLMVFAFLVGSNMIIFTITWPGRIILTVSCAFIVAVAGVKSLAPSVFYLFKVKLQRQKHEKFGPICLSAKRVQDMLVDFVFKLENPEFVSMENFQQYLQEEHIAKHGYAAAIAPITNLRISRIVDTALESFLTCDCSGMNASQLEENLRKQWASMSIY
eukprot:g58978.t1